MSTWEPEFTFKFQGTVEENTEDIQLGMIY